MRTEKGPLARAPFCAGWLPKAQFRARMAMFSTEAKPTQAA